MGALCLVVLVSATKYYAVIGKLGGGGVCKARDKDDLQTEIDRLRTSERDLLKQVGRLEVRLEILKEQQDNEGDD